MRKLFRMRTRNDTQTDKTKWKPKQQTHSNSARNIQTRTKEEEKTNGTNRNAIEEVQNPVVSFLFDSFRISRDIYERLICQMYEKYLTYNTHGTESVHMHKKLFISFLSFSTHSVPRTMTITKWKRVIHKYYFNFITVKNTTDIRISERTRVRVWECEGKQSEKEEGETKEDFKLTQNM